MALTISPAGGTTPAYGLSDPIQGTTPYEGIFIPELWSGKLIEKFYDATVLAAIANTDYEGEISNFGDKVNIRIKPGINISDYHPYQALNVQVPTAPKVVLNIDSGKYWNTILEDVQEIQSDVDHLSMWADDASEQMKIEIDTDILAAMAGTADAFNRGAGAGRISQNIDLGAAASAISITPANVIDYMTEVGQVLDEQNIPETGRWFVIPAWFATKIKRSELRDSSLTNDGASMTRNGRLGMIDRFTLYSSNLLPSSGGEYTVYAGHSHGLTFASQLTKVETLRGESTFGTLMRGLQVFGHKVINGTAIVEAVVSPA